MPASIEGSDAKRLVNPARIVVPGVKGNRPAVVVQLFGESIGQPGESAHPHPHGQILSLCETGRDVLAFGVPDDTDSPAPNALRWTAAIHFSLRVIAIQLDHLPDSLCRPGAAFAPGDWPDSRVREQAGEEGAPANGA